jgi:methyl-accepting chemotaxis protein
VSRLRNWKGLVERCLNPAAGLIGRLRYSQKFLLIGLVLIAPLIYVVVSYLGVQSRDTSFAVKERVGVVYLRPATQLLDRVVRARAVAVRVAARKTDRAAFAAARTDINQAIARLDAAHDAGATLGLTRQWAALKARIQTVAAAPITTPAKALADYDGLATGVEALIAADGNNSNMILDPDNDAYYVMDAVLNRVTLLLDTSGQAGDLQIVIAAGGRATLPKRLELEDLKGTILTTLSNSDPDYASAFANTHYSAMRGLLSRPVAGFDGSLGAVTSQLSSGVYGKLDGAKAGRLGAAAQANGMALDRASLPVIDHLLSARIGKFGAASKRTEAIALLAVLIALYLFAGFYLSVRRSQTAILDGLEGLRENATDPLAEGLDAMATGDLTRSIDPSSPPIVATTRDELGQLAAAVDAIRERVLASIASFNAMADRMRAMLGEVATSAAAVSAASGQVSSTSGEAGQATTEIAQAVGDVAHGAERQVGMVEDARRVADAVVHAIGESATSAQLTAEVGQEARRAAGEGVAAAAQASAAMQSVRDSSQAVSDAIAGLAAKSEQIGAIVQTITGIAEQTNLLALNAAIEAARAGEQGRGFAVVAEEVRKLAEDSQQAAAQISDLIRSIQAETTNTVAVVHEGARRTDEGAGVVEQTRQAFERIGAAVDDMTARVERIAADSEQTAAGANRMQASITEVAAVAEQSSASAEQVSASTEETAAATQQITASAEELNRTAETLEQLVSRFRLSR